MALIFYHRGKTMDYDIIITVTAWVTLAAFLWSIHKDIAGLSERIARLEGSVDVLKDLVRSSLTGKSQ